jgi:hypothetical protein
MSIAGAILVCSGALSLMIDLIVSAHLLWRNKPEPYQPLRVGPRRLPNCLD